ncbi:MAG: DUF4032 domain-containing protein [Kiritimatiellae bacterium]|nr:DUF4032 domain-containing protein [Kiritimatiellia bacterium]
MDAFGCKNFREYLLAQRRRLDEALAENKWYLSERAGRDVGMAAAKEDFLKHHFERVARQFRAWYCGVECRLRASCELAVGQDPLPPAAGCGR